MYIVDFTCNEPTPNPTGYTEVRYEYRHEKKATAIRTAENIFRDSSKTVNVWLVDEDNLSQRVYQMVGRFDSSTHGIDRHGEVFEYGEPLPKL